MITLNNIRTERKEVIPMKIKKKSVFTRMLSLMAAVLSLGLVLSFTAVSASAAEAPAKAIVTMELSPVGHVIQPMANGGQQGQQDDQPGSTAEGAYHTTIDFFITWIRRIGAAVGLIGGIMFGLAIKDNNADQKQVGLMTMVSGFVVWGVCSAASMFDLFS